MNNSAVQKLIIMLSFVSVLFFACSDDDPTGPGSNQLIGIWEADIHTTFYGSVSSPDSSKNEIFDSDNQFTLTFNDNNSYSAVFVVFGNTKIEEGTWSVNGNNLTIRGPDDDATGNYSISGNQLTLEFGETFSDYTTFEVFVYTKQ